MSQADSDFRVCNDRVELEGKWICCSNYYQAALNINFICFIFVELQGSQLRDLCIEVDKMLLEGDPSNDKENQPRPNCRKVDRLSSQSKH